MVKNNVGNRPINQNILGPHIKVTNKIMDTKQTGVLE